MNKKLYVRIRRPALFPAFETGLRHTPAPQDGVASINEKTGRYKTGRSQHYLNPALSHIAESGCITKNAPLEVEGEEYGSLGGSPHSETVGRGVRIVALHDILLDGVACSVEVLALVFALALIYIIDTEAEFAADRHFGCEEIFHSHETVKADAYHRGALDIGSTCTHLALAVGVEIP